MEPVYINTNHGYGPPPNEPLQAKKFKPVLIYSNNQVRPRRDSPATTEIALTGSWQENTQLAPHIRLRVWWPLRDNTPATIFNSEEFTCNYQLAEEG